MVARDGVEPPTPAFSGPGSYLRTHETIRTSVAEFERRDHDPNIVEE